MRFIVAFAWYAGKQGQWQVLDTQDNCKVVFSSASRAESSTKRDAFNAPSSLAVLTGEVVS